MFKMVGTNWITPKGIRFHIAAYIRPGDTVVLTIEGSGESHFMSAVEFNNLKRAGHYKRDL